GLIKNTQLDTSKKQLADYNKELQRQHEYADMAPNDAAAMKAYYDTRDAAQKAGIKNAEALAKQNAEVARSTYEMQQRMQESIRFAQEMKDKFSDAITDIIFDFHSAKDAAKQFAEQIAKMILQKQVVGPMVDSLLGASGGGSGIIGSLFSSFSGMAFAKGGRP